MNARRELVAAALVCAVVLTIYLPDLGHGFIKDDYHWIRVSRVSAVADVAALFRSNVGFYRPLTALTFAADYAASAMSPFGYGLTNLLILGIDAALLYALARRFGLTAPAALFGAAVWTLNFHAVNMALLWISGRTALLVTMWSLAAALACLGRRSLLAGVFALAAMLCKEEAVMLPLLFALSLTIDHVETAGSASGMSTNELDSTPHSPESSTLTAVLSRCWPMAVALVVYAALRMQSGAFGAFDAPSYYRFSFSPAIVLRNIAEYADRAATATALAVLILFTAAGAWTRRPLSSVERRVLLFAAVWIPATFAVTVFLPVRSSLYALLPAVGTALAGAVAASYAGRVMPERFPRAVTALVVIAALLIPVYRLRNRRWVDAGDLSSRVMRTVAGNGAAPSSARLVLVDDPDAAVTLDSAFGTLFPDAVALMLGEHASGQIVQPGEPIPSDATHVYRLMDGGLATAGPSAVGSRQ